LSNPVCLVSGSSSGIGAATVRTFARQGYDVVVNYNSGADRAEAVARQIRDTHGVEALVVGADLSQRDEPHRLVDAAYDHFGRLDVTVSNSGVANYLRDRSGELVRHRFDETPIEHLDAEMERVLSLNLMGAYRLGQRSLQRMIEQAKSELASQSGNPPPQHRSILFITSISDVAPESTRIPYGVSKAAVNHLVTGAALDGGRYNVTVNALRPGVVDTPLTDRPSGIMDPQSGEELTVAQTYELMAVGGSQPIQRIGTPDEIAEAAYAFTRIPFMTGQLVAVDGGFTLASGFQNRDLFLQEGLKRRKRG
jgi:NAD(P)-dependent dehydrogenase (short-subunit alcohol dehydrogenase family)